MSTFSESGSRGAGKLWVVKVGGSLCRRDDLTRIVRRVANMACPPVVVPGGGPFADQVRSTQRQLSFSDQAAHRMAVLGMHQYGYMIADLAGLKTTDSMETLRGGEVYLPPVEVVAKALPASWTVTSDSIAAWLTLKIAADCLVLLKPVAKKLAGSHNSLTDEYFSVLSARGLRYIVLSADEWFEYQPDKMPVEN